jgi:hypothetical protein
VVVDDIELVAPGVVVETNVEIIGVLAMVGELVIKRRSVAVGAGVLVSLANLTFINWEVL